MKNLSTLIGACLLCMTAQPLYAEPSPEEVQQTMSSILLKIENAAGIDHKASNGIKELDEESKKTLYDSVDNKDKFVNSAHKALKRIESARAADLIIQDAPLESPIMQDASDVAFSTALGLNLTTPYPPNYTQSGAFLIASNLGLTPSIDQRCEGPGLEIYEILHYEAEKLADIGDAACSFAGCDPSGIGCAIVCGVTEVYKLAVITARIPLDACDKHSASVDAAEIEAGYENSVGILNNINSTAKVVIENQDKILKNQEGFLKNQEEIIRLLNSPQGQRPSWNQ